MCTTTYKAGDVILVYFPFTNFTETKKRPALVIRNQYQQDVLCVPISSQISTHQADILLLNNDCKGFKFPIDSYVRSTKLMTIETSLIHKQLGVLSASSFTQIKTLILKFVKS